MSSQTTTEEYVYAELTDDRLIAEKKNVILTIEAKDRVEAMVERTKIESMAQNIIIDNSAQKADVSYKDSNLRALQGDISFGVHGGNDTQEADIQKRRKQVASTSAGPKSTIVSLEGITRSELDSLSLDRLVDLYTQYRNNHPENPLVTIFPDMVRRMGEFGARNFLASLLPQAAHLQNI